jgi:probable F420-dependent oxidoreductase
MSAGIREESAMQFHLAIPNFGPGSSPEAMTEIAEEAEELGFDGIGTTDHLMVPKGMPDRYERIFEALTVLAYLAARTRRVKLITSVIVLLMRNPFAVAKQAATIDQLSGGRLELGLGVGWNELEFANVHADFRNRGRRLDEAIRLFRHLFSGSREPFQGTYYSYEDGVSEPLPVRREKLPILIGGNSDAALKRAARLADGWESTGLDPETWQERVRLLTAEAEAAGRSVEAGARLDLTGTAQEMLDEVRRWQDAGADHLMIGLGFTDGFADRMRVLGREVMPAARAAT